MIRKAVIIVLGSLLVTMCMIGVESSDTYVTASQATSSFEATERALAKALTTIDHPSLVSQTGFSGTPEKDLLKLSLAIKYVVSPNLINSLVEAYLHSASMLDPGSQQNQFLKPYEFVVYVHMWHLNGPIWFAGTKSPGSNTIKWKYDNPQPKWVPVHNVMLAISKIPGHRWKQLELVNVHGLYAVNPDIGPFMGNNWIGHFQLRVVDHTGKIFSVFNLPDNKFVQYLFMRKFQFSFADYNGDGYPDFTLGQYFGSNGNTYEIYTIKPDGLFQLPTVPAELFVADFSYSPLFKQVKPNGFQIKFYDNAKAEWFQVTYVWKDGKFVQSSVKASHTP